MQNVTQFKTDEHDMVSVTIDPTYHAFTGISDLMPGVEHSGIRALFTMYQTVHQGAVLDRALSRF